MIEWIRTLLEDENMRSMGHAQRKKDDNLGLGWLYYALARIQRCRTAVVIGSYRGFVPLMIAKALRDNEEKGEVFFIDPSLWDGFWRNPTNVDAQFQRFGIDNVRHFPSTTQDFVKTSEYASLSDIGLLFIDGHHTYEQVRFDYSSFESKLAADGIVLFHDSMSLSPETYGPIKDLYITGVTFFMDELEARADLQVFDFPRNSDAAAFTTGLTIVRRKTFAADSAYFRNPDMPGYESLRTGVDLFNRGQAQDAVEHFAKVIDQHPTFGAAWLLKGTALVAIGAHDDGVSHLQKSHELGHRRASGLLATINRELGRD